MGVLVICVLIFTVFCTFLLCFCIGYVYLFLLVVSVLMQGLLPPSDNAIAVVVVVVVVVVTIITPDGKATTQSEYALCDILEKRRMLRNSPQSLSF